MSVRTWGQGGKGTATALMLHCTLAQGSAWAGVARHLKGDLNLTAPDLLAHGDGPGHDAARDFHDQATEAALSHLPQTPTHLIGHSFGATLALRLALDHPARVRSLTLIEPVLFCAALGPGRAAHDAHMAPMTPQLTRDDPAAAARIFLSLWGAAPFETLPPALQTYITQRIWIPDACAPALIHDTANLLPRIPSLNRPVLLIQGANSPPVMSEITAHLSATLPNAQTQILPGAAHMAPLTHPRETASAIAAFIAAA